jgi:hypothetical protein
MQATTENIPERKQRVSKKDVQEIHKRDLGEIHKIVST